MPHCPTSCHPSPIPDMSFTSTACGRPLAQLDAIEPNIWRMLPQRVSFCRLAYVLCPGPLYARGGTVSIDSIHIRWASSEGKQKSKGHRSSHALQRAVRRTRSLMVRIMCIVPEGFKCQCSIGEIVPRWITEPKTETFQ
jgi:hypothetical protein